MIGDGTTIRAESRGAARDVDTDTLRAYFLGGAYDEATVWRFVDELWRVCTATQLRISVVAGQIANETKRFRFGGAVGPDQFNLAGIGSTDDGAAGQSFASIEEGVRAVAAHHGGYLFGPAERWPVAWRELLPLAVRLPVVLRAGYGGTVATLGDYGAGRWATDKDYAAKVARHANALLAMEAPSMGTIAKPPMDTRHPSPNRGYTNGHQHRVEAIFDHITDGTNSLGWLTNPASNASSNYLIARNGTIYELVKPTVPAWANGAVNKPNTANPLIAKWQREIVNGRAVNFNQRGVSIEHEARRGEGLTPAQLAASAHLHGWLAQEFGLTPDAVMGHNQIDSVNRPHCPGFTAREWAALKSRMGGGPPPATAEPYARTYINAQGETITEINWRGYATAVEGFIVVDAGVTVVGRDGKTIYDQSLQQPGGFTGWKEREWPQGK